MLARGVRLWIVLLPALLLGAVLDGVGTTYFASPLYEGNQGSVALNYAVSDRLTLPTFIGNALFLQDITVKAFGSNGALWTVACEFWYYVYFPFAWLAVRSKNVFWIALVLAAFYFVPAKHLFVCWLMGGAVYLIAERLIADRLVHWAMPVVALIGFCGLNALSKLLSWPEVVNDLALALSFGAFLILGMRSPFGAATPFGFVARLGSRSSYSLYAIHLPIVVFVCNFLVPTSRIPANAYSWSIVAAISLFCAILAIGFSLLTEDKTAKSKAWISSQFSGRLGARRGSISPH